MTNTRAPSCQPPIRGRADTGGDGPTGVALGLAGPGHLALAVRLDDHEPGVEVLGAHQPLAYPALRPLRTNDSRSCTNLVTGQLTVRDSNDFRSRVVRSTSSIATSPATNDAEYQGASRRPASRRHGLIP